MVELVTVTISVEINMNYNYKEEMLKYMSLEYIFYLICKFGSDLGTHL